VSIAKSHDFISVEQYLEDELNSEIRHEYRDGYVYAMSGASKNHRRLSVNVVTMFHSHLQSGPCEASIADARVKTGSSYFYPDVVVDCDDSDDNSTYAKKPTIIVEVLSRSTRHTDKGVKLLSYINMPHLEEYVLIEQEYASVEVFRKSDGWVPRHYSLGDEIQFESIELLMSVEDIYHRVSNKDVVEFFENKATD
jgi:Uma2 family endonuclease